MTSQEGGMGIVVRAGGKITFVGSAFSAGAWFDRGCLSINFVWPAVTKGRHDIIWKADMTSYHKPNDQSLIHRPIGFSIGQATEKWLVFLHCIVIFSPWARLTRRTSHFICSLNWPFQESWEQIDDILLLSISVFALHNLILLLWLREQGEALGISEESNICLHLVPKA